ISGNVSHRSDEQTDSLLREVLLNPNVSTFWLSYYRADINYMDFTKSDFWYKITVDQDGIFKLDHNQLSSLPAYVDPRQIRIFSTGGKPLNQSSDGFPVKEIPILVEGGDDGIMDNSVEIYFYGRDRDNDGFNNINSSIYYFNPYSGGGVYWLTFGGDFSGEPRRINSKSYSGNYSAYTKVPIQTHLEEEVYQTSKDFQWAWRKYFGVETATYNLDFNLSDIDLNSTQTAKFRFLGDSGSITYSLSVEINGHVIIDNNQYSGFIFYPNGSGEFLINGNNNVKITVQRDSAADLYLDYLDLNYQKILNKSATQFEMPIIENSHISYAKYVFTGNNTNLHIYEVNDFDDVNLINANPTSTGFEFNGLVNSSVVYYISNHNDYLTVQSFLEQNNKDIINESTPYDCIIITPEIFAEQAGEIKNLHSTYFGINTKIVDLNNVFAHFNGGMDDPYAIRNFLKHAFNEYPSTEEHNLRYVLLMGSGSSDWRNFSSRATEKNKMIVLLKDFPTDDKFTIFGSSLPNLSIGRLPAENVQEMNTIIAKLKQYIENPTPGSWKNKVMIVADDLYNDGSSDGIPHTEQAEETFQALNAGVYVDKIFGVEHVLDEMQKKPTVTASIVNGVNEGRLIWYFIGHGNVDLLASEDYFRGTNDLVKLRNADKPTLFIAASCDVGFFDSYSFDSLAEKMITYNNGGSIASIASSRKSSGSTNTMFLKYFLVRLLNDRRNLGDALLQAKLAYNNSMLNNSKYSLMGDPVINILLPLSLQNQFNGVIHARETATLSGEFPVLNLNGNAEIFVWDNEFRKTASIPNSNSTQEYTVYGYQIFRGELTTENSTYNSSFIVPDDIRGGNKGRTLAYIHTDSGETYVSFFDDISFDKTAIEVTDSQGPDISLWMNSKSFKSGDIVDTSPTLLADISDENGINISGASGHKMFVLFDDDINPIDVTAGFSYNKDSYQDGILVWQFNNLSEGKHVLKIIVYDNFSNPSIAEIEFYSRGGGNIAISEMLPYPNPMPKTGGNFTFRLNNEATVSISIYTITGKKIKTIRNRNCTAGYNIIEWDGRDEDGDKIANNNYFYKIKANTADNKSIEKTGKFIILE
ncbi:MAG: type IX secretion system sortase PorU, partial [Candidatus Cloacimonetes bacterium]|nr:type IX secretion system sortase PorU [Candidatus Cloacimonadota bacterium]